MRVIAIDTGYERLGIAILDAENGSETLVHSECFKTPRTDVFPERLAQIATHIQACVETYAPEACAIETLWFNVNKTTALTVAHARGVVVAAVAMRGVPVYEYSPQAIKIALTGHGNSDKKQVTDMVTRIVANAPDTAHDDEYDAIAVGITHIAHTKNTGI